jgi:hypothetical protein
VINKAGGYQLQYPEVVVGASSGGDVTQASSNSGVVSLSPGSLSAAIISAYVACAATSFFWPLV